MSESAPPSLVAPSGRRRRAAAIAYLVVAILVSLAIAREYSRVKHGKTAAANLHSAERDMAV